MWLLVPARGAAQSPAPEQMLTLKSGAVLVGALVEYVPQSHVTLRLATGEIRRCDWAEIANYVPPSVASAPPRVVAVDLPPPLLSPPKSAAPLPIARVFIDSNDSAATLDRQAGQSAVVGYSSNGTFVGTVTLWQTVCQAPCGQPIERAGEFAIRGFGIVPSKSFALPSSGETTIRVKAGHRGPRIGAAMATSFGFVAALGGLVMLIVGPALYNPNDPFLNNSVFTTPAEKAAKQSLSKSLTIGGGVTLGLGLALTAGGIAGVVLTRTTVTVE
jgi:hypothetical protein